MYVNARYVLDVEGTPISLSVDIDGMAGSVPLDHRNSDYVAIMRLHSAGLLVIDDGVPPPAYVPEVISDRQFFQGLAVSGIISKPEALAAVKTGAIPAALQVIVDAMGDANTKFAIEMLLSGATSFERHHPFSEAVRVARNMTNEQVDDFWRMCATL